MGKSSRTKIFLEKFPSEKTTKNRRPGRKAFPGKKLRTEVAFRLGDLDSVNKTKKFVRKSLLTINLPNKKSQFEKNSCSKVKVFEGNL